MASPRRWVVPGRNSFLVAAAILGLAATLTLAVRSGLGEGQGAPSPKRPDVILATTTSTQDSGLLDVLVPMFEEKTGYRVKTIAVGTGQALAMGGRGEADVLLVHAPDAEEEAVARGTAVNRRLVMHNTFVIVGPSQDPAKVRGSKTASQALARIAALGATFISRGDGSGTHQKELSLWSLAGVKPGPGGRWYQESGSGMGLTLNIASEKNAYTLTDRATYLALRGKLGLEILLERDPLLFNIYHVMQVNPKVFSKVNALGGKAFVEFLVSREAQEAIGKFGVDKFGEPMFFPDAGSEGATPGEQR